ncbi:Alpha-D-glucose 1-phosphate phosphatase YihX [Pseudomonas carnis]|nr:Alpha-D-glucose 1-phosphate phosphatase YihX [Pseudomonas carnis]CAH0154030.1 Alpha-D-glucose 1-phosphate phosphatase YihX [Pseudomonas carnis]CAH0213745.1 Alpha-D-glucose 1-phosphate phosphatase YihX [Pseudomonas carnis]CAH0226751.1 Alpha-D-glucose 1-phosphate phosphatase YihX [Pseudomonas carnis]
MYSGTVTTTVTEEAVIHAIMVDVDGVIVNGRPSDGEGWASSLEEDLGLAFSDLHAVLFEPHWDDIVTGKLSLKATLKSVLPSIAPGLSPQTLLKYWFENDARLDLRLLADLDEQRRHGVKVYLATNQEHLRARYLMESIGLSQYCDGIFYSAALSCRKPETHFYEKVTELSGLRPEQLLLIDDTPANVLAARNLGWNAIEWHKTSTLAGQIDTLQLATRCIG